MTIDTSREAIDRMTGMWGVGVEPNMARVTEVLTALASERDEALAREAVLREALTRAADDLSLYARHGITAFHGERASRAALTNTAAAAEARDAALVERGRREGLRRRSGGSRCSRSSPTTAASST